jgi:uncharacterized protein (TIGR03086 family)
LSQARVDATPKAGIDLVTIDDLRGLHRQAIADADSFVRQVTSDDYGRPTPCVGWDLSQLLAHMVGQHRGFAAAVRDGTADKCAYAPVPFDRDAWAASSDELLAAFAGAAEHDQILQVELNATERLPLQFVLSAQLLDTVVHNWDVASALGRPYNPSHQLVGPILTLAERIPDGEERKKPGAAFGPALLPPPDGDWGRLLALLGRRSGS